MAEKLTHAQRIQNIPHDKLVELIWKNLKEIYETMKFHRGNIIEVCKGKRKLANNYKWKYKEENTNEQKI